jgi:hypothetical protein
MQASARRAAEINDLFDGEMVDDDSTHYREKVV